MPCGAAPSRQCVYQFHHQGGSGNLESAPWGVNRCGAARRPALDWCPMELWVAFGFGALIGAFIGTLIGRHRAARGTAAPVAPPPPAQRFAPPEVQHVVLDEGSANVLNALNNRLAAIGALADLLHGSPLDPERARALMMLHGEVRRAAEITQHFLELAQHPIGAAEPSDCSIVLNGVLPEREGTLKELGVKLVRSIPHDLPMVPCPMAQLPEMLMKLPAFRLPRPAAVQRHPELRVAATGQAMRLLLEREGHEVVAVENGLEAIERLGPASDRFDAVVTDLQMPRLGGRALYEQLREQRPQLAERFVFVTGDRARDETRRFLDECGQPSVMKPYDFSDLIGALGKVAVKKQRRSPHHLRLAFERDAETLLHPGSNRIGECQQLGAGSAQIHQRERVALRDARAAQPVALGKTGSLDQPRRRYLH